MLRLLTGAILCAWATAASAALAPNYERLRELEAILQNQELIQKLGIEEITSIEATRNTTYTIRTATCTVVVTLVATPNAPPLLGPWQFTIQVGDPQCPKVPLTH
jgi:hypothetical protein